MGRYRSKEGKGKQDKERHAALVKVSGASIPPRGSVAAFKHRGWVSIHITSVLHVARLMELLCSSFEWHKEKVIHFLSASLNGYFLKEYVTHVLTYRVLTCRG